MRFLRLLLVVVLIGVLLASQAARFLIVDNAQKSDAIVVLAGETSMRPARALELLRQGMAPRMFLDAEAGEQIYDRSEEHTSELQSLRHLVCRLLLDKKNNKSYVEVWTSCIRGRFFCHVG